MKIPNPDDVSKGWLHAFKGDKSIRTINEIPEGYSDISFSGCTNLRWIGKLPSSTRSLKLEGCHRLWWLPDLSKLPNLQDLNVGGTSLRKIDALPASLEYLDTRACRRLRRIKALPPALKALFVHDCDRLATVGAMPDTLTHYAANGCSRLSNIGKLSSTLRVLYLAHTQVRSVGNLPASLWSLDLSHTPVSQLDLSPATGLSELSLNGCVSLRGKLELPSNIQNFSGRGLADLIVSPLGQTHFHF